MLKTVLWTAAVLGVLLGGLRLVALRWWQVPLDDDEFAASLAPTLRAGDWIILWRLTPPGFGDLAMCDDPDNPGYKVIGRIAGEGNDQIRVKAADITINKKKQATESACNPSRVEVADPTSGASVQLTCSIEAMGGVKHMRLNSKKTSDFSTEVEPGFLFLLSDNRDMPYDSRNYGNLDKDTCKESVVFRLVSAEGMSDVESRFTFIQ
jgi:signal peptidase I